MTLTYGVRTDMAPSVEKIDNQTNVITYSFACLMEDVVDLERRIPAPRDNKLSLRVEGYTVQGPPETQTPSALQQGL